MKEQIITSQKTKKLKQKKTEKITETKPVKWVTEYEVFLAAL